MQLQDELTQIKREALERFAAGELEGEELMSGFLVHASDARDFLIRLILHERENLEDRARAQDRPAEALWNEAVGEPSHATPANRTRQRAAPLFSCPFRPARRLRCPKRLRTVAGRD